VKKTWLIFSLLTLSLSLTVPAVAEVVRVPLLADTYVYSYEPDNNYAMSTQLNVGRIAWESTWTTQRTYLKFDLSSIPDNATINSATLRVYSYVAPYTFELQVYHANDSWTEGSVTWNNQPGTTVLLGSRSGLAVNSWNNWSLNPSLITGDLADNELSLQIRHGNEAYTGRVNSYAYFYSSFAAGDYAPTLDIDYSPAPPAPSKDMTPSVILLLDS